MFYLVLARYLLNRSVTDTQFFGATQMTIEQTVSSQNAQRVLLVEDNTVERMRMRSLLSHMGYDLVVAEDGPEALAALEEDDFDIVVSDWELPTDSGVDLCQRVNRWALFDRPYFIMVTGRDTTEDLEAARSAGVDDYLNKPVSKAMLAARLQAGEQSVHRRRVSNGVSR